MCRIAKFGCKVVVMAPTPQLTRGRAMVFGSDAANPSSGGPVSSICYALGAAVWVVVAGRSLK
jgi:hypothetical protein